ncbi:diguanylate cyclase [Sulfurimonas aquatica]|uniref:Diguanylate cyclase n=1 Tax=Sulfurimonas aquatica TaxID=2672570 RepID=A0A975GCC0_9BACT|nr:diguanylate cyclase [Sulfurimonas aquatica]QSZ41465.1 diguanylate cyclase [Sulfurimonas aquatica]
MELLHIDEHELEISASIGISIYPTHATEANELLKYADIAMYGAKSDKKSNFQFYTP